MPRAPKSAFEPRHDYPVPFCNHLRQPDICRYDKGDAMRTIRKIICPVDIYHFVPEVAEYAMDLAASFEAKILVLYALEPLPVAIGVNLHVFAPDFEQELKRYAESKMTELLMRHFTVGRDEGKVVSGDPADKIVTIAENTPGGLIVMASYCRSSVCRALHGSVTSAVLALSKAPVLVVRPKE